MEPEAIQNLFIDARLNAGHTQIQASQEVGCGLSTISHLENQGRIPTTQAFLRNIEMYIKTNSPKTSKKGAQA